MKRYYINEKTIEIYFYIVERAMTIPFRRKERKLTNYLLKRYLWNQAAVNSG